MIDWQYKESPEKFMKYLSDREYAVNFLTKKAVDDFMKFNPISYQAKNGKWDNVLRRVVRNMEWIRHQSVGVIKHDGVWRLNDISEKNSFGWDQSALPFKHEESKSFNYLRYWVNKFVSNTTEKITFNDEHIAYMAGQHHAPTNRN